MRSPFPLYLSVIVRFNRLSFSLHIFADSAHGFNGIEDNAEILYAVDHHGRAEEDHQRFSACKRINDQKQSENTGNGCENQNRVPAL